MENIGSKVKVRHKFRKDLIQEVCIKIGAPHITILLSTLKVALSL